MTGYQEILTDPSYRGQIVVMTQPHIGNYGTAAELGESRQPWVEAFVAHQFTARHSGSGEGEPAAVPARARHPGARTRSTPAAWCGGCASAARMRGVLTSERSDVAALVAEVRDFAADGRAARWSTR